ncbi:MurR/RpiR family transcriptional regulator [Erysipelothrix sp. HDW6C]|uniref:MurR/RpiR family transcriptional regulator n=1 Tax=Erysipelothrix sp. HDW6C TaxID=2714930 RepID=UPI00140826E0|nr:MurR/RpiR family transcriptional regulator [Erysipelothrix sp. HDW6C]QIK68821.1 MurR/RpiR family transcriptional regulator [Erysipelothrix sp. HDW6C]
MRNIISYLEYNLAEFTESEQIIAKYFIHKKNLEQTRIVDVAEELYISTATISRFINKIGFENYKAFLYEFQNSLDFTKSDIIAINSEARDMWNVHHKYYEALYENLSTIDLNYIANRMLNSKLVYTFGFGKTHDATNMIIYRLETLLQHIRSVPHYEHLMYTIKNVMTYEHVVIVFYQSNYFKDELNEVITAAKQKYVPIIILTLSADIDDQNYARVYKLYPFEDDTVVKYSTTMYTPYLLFIDTIYMAINKKVGNTKLNYM